MRSMGDGAVVGAHNRICRGGLLLRSRDSMA
jgi:hypothetical protein